ncbi:MAG: hypothetical protein HYS27_11885 [Deltaproteobacteria bacterium]|nr:hypothetical protein [Deltaproteobacteria bacterium]
MIAVAWLAALQLAGADAALERCRQLDREFDTKNMPKPCQAAADDASATVAERVEALRLLAFAHVLNGDEALAEPAFLRMLVLSPTSVLPADAGPQFRKAFAAARSRFDTEGAVTTSFTAPLVDGAKRAPIALQVDVADRLGRVASARVLSTVAGASAPLEERMVKSELGAGQVRFTGTVPEPPGPSAYSLGYQVVLDGWDGAPVPLPAPLAGTVARDAASVVPPIGEGGELPWGWIIGGGAASVALVAATGGGIAWCFVAGPCRQQSAWVRVQLVQGAAP